MSTTTPSTQYGLNYWVAQTRRTRRYGHTYVHAGARASAPFSFRSFERGGVIFSFTGWGRSLQGGGHKYKVHARHSDTGKPVPSKLLETLQA